MWTCRKCGERVEDDFEVCWSCGTSMEGIEDPAFDPEVEGMMGEHAYQTQQAAQRQEDLVTVASFGNPLQAHVVRSRLEAEGIHAYVTGELSNSIWGTVNPGGVKLEVAGKDVDRAHLVLATIEHTSPPEFEEDDETDERIQAASDLDGIKKLDDEK